MKINLNWLKDYVSFEYEPQALADQLTMIGLEVEEILSLAPSFSDVIVCKIEAVDPHPNADKLTICQVNTGSEKLSLVCGAPNVMAGQLVPVACVGAVLGEMVIKKAKIRSVESQGMICSERELGLSDDHSGILVLDDGKFKIGDNFSPADKSVDTVFDISITPNRPDCLSHIGIAREVGAAAETQLSKPSDEVKEQSTPVSDLARVIIEDSEACPRYCARVIQDIKIGPSPSWLAKRLESIGIRSINNVVDITNYVLMETGHPLHAFDYDLVQKQTIVVRKANKGEVFTTLDDVNRQLEPNDLLICDGERPVGLAGIMGGLNSEISENTKNILIESAYFDPMTIRRTAKRLGLNTEASQRFEKGADPENTVYAVNRAAQMMVDLAEGKAAKGILDGYPCKMNFWDVSLRLSRINTVLGVDIPKEKVVSILNSLDLHVENGDPLKVTIPTFRQDLTREIDLIEEVVRHYGYDKIPHRLYSNVALTSESKSESEFAETVKDIFVGMGFLEIYSNSMVSQKHTTQIVPESQPVVVANPLSPETSFLRTNPIAGLLNAILWNQNRSSSNLRLFEIARVFQKQNAKLPKESIVLAGALTGSVKSKPFFGEKEAACNFYHLRGVVESLLERLHISNVNFISSEPNYLIPESTLEIHVENKYLGVLGEITKHLQNSWDIQNSVFTFELDMSHLQACMPQRSQFTAIPRFPAIKRDLAVILDETIPVGSVEEDIVKKGTNSLSGIEIFDVYRGKQVPADKKSVAFSLSFQSPDRTLTEEEIDPIISSILQSLEKNFSAALRS